MEEDIQKQIEQGIKQHFRTIGSKGGKTTVERRGREYMRELGRKSAEKRRANKEANENN